MKKFADSKFLKSCDKDAMFEVFKVKILQPSRLKAISVLHWLYFDDFFSLFWFFFFAKSGNSKEKFFEAYIIFWQVKILMMHNLLSFFDRELNPRPVGIQFLRDIIIFNTPISRMKLSSWSWIIYENKTAKSFSSIGSAKNYKTAGLTATPLSRSYVCFVFLLSHFSIYEIRLKILLKPFFCF